MYKVVVADDEYWALQGVVNSFSWAKYGFEVVFSTTKSLEAYEYIKSNDPDVVFTDVCMPDMSGVELCRRSREEGFSALFVFVSGYDDYKYTREAIRNGAFDYCLKPIDDEETDAILTRLKAHLESMSYETEADEENEISSANSGGETSRSKEIYNREFKQMMDYIDENFTQPLLLKNLAMQFYINESYCCYLFNKHIGISFSKYLNKLRIEHAMEIIKNNRTLSIDEVAERTGYASYYHFNKKFKEITGVSPARYRKGLNSEN